jgi:hypothetical protein
MDKQEIFDHVWNELHKQKIPARDLKGLCKYRVVHNESGVMLKCAAGHLIPDELYNKNMEGRGITELVKASIDFPYNFPEYFKDNLGLISDLQVAHDEIMSDSIAFWHEEMIGIAREHDLKVPEVPVC